MGGGGGGGWWWGGGGQRMPLMGPFNNSQRGSGLPMFPHALGLVNYALFFSFFFSNYAI